MAAPAPQGPCRNFGSQGGCRFGKRCKFSHDLGSTSPLQSPHQNVPSPPTFNTQRTRPARNGNAAPKNVCNFYWNTGQCERGFDCTYKHQKNTKPLCNVANTPGGVEDEEDVPNSALEFFTTDNLTQMAGVGLASAQEGTPENAHNAIKRYLGGGPLNKPSDMKPLTSILASVNRRNRSWTVDKAQEFLDMIIRSDELSNRIGDILKFPDVSPSAATGLTHLSFQLDYFPVLEYFTSDLVLKSTLHHNINALYAVLYEHWEIVSLITPDVTPTTLPTLNHCHSQLRSDAQGGYIRQHGATLNIVSLQTHQTLHPLYLRPDHSLSIMGSVVSAIGGIIGTIVSAITSVILIIVNSIVAVLVLIWDLIVDILCCRCCSGRRRVGTRSRFGRSSRY